MSRELPRLWGRHQKRLRTGVRAKRPRVLNARGWALAYTLVLLVVATSRGWAADPLATPFVTADLGAELRAIAVTEDASKIAAVGSTGFSVEGHQAGLLTVWDGVGSERWSVTNPGAILCVGWTRSGDMLAFGADDGFAQLYLRDGSNRRWPAAEAPVLACAFSADGTRLLTGGADHVIRVWDVASGAAVGEMLGHSGPVFALCVSRDGQQVASGGADGAVMVWEMATLELVTRIVPHGNTVSSVAFTSDGSRVVSGGWDGRVAITTVADGSTRQIDRLAQPVLAVDVAADDGMVVAGAAAGGDGSLAFWRLDTGERAATLVRPVTPAARFVGSGVLATGYDTGEVRLWRADPSIPTPVVPTGQQATTLRWQDASAVYYEAQFGRAAPLRDGDATELTRGTSVDLPESFVDGSTVWWRVRSHGFGGPTEWSETRSVVTEGPPSSVARVWIEVSPARAAVGDAVQAQVHIADAVDLVSFSTDIVVDSRALGLVGAVAGEALTADGSPLQWGSPLAREENGSVALTGVSGVRLGDGGINARGALLTVDFVAQEAGEAPIRVRNMKLTDARGGVIETEIAAASVTVFEALGPEDVTRDGFVDIRDLVDVAKFFGMRAVDEASTRVDVDQNGVIDIFDLLLVARAFATVEDVLAAAPSHAASAGLARARDHMRRLGPVPARDPNWSHLLNLLDALAGPSSVGMSPFTLSVGKAHPNPSNPETWIPFGLSRRADVRVFIYDTRGSLVRTLDLGAREAGVYSAHRGAARWDGRDSLGQRAASGVYIARLFAYPLAGGTAVFDSVRVVVGR
jgi:hypothetical protein